VGDGMVFAFCGTSCQRGGKWDGFWMV
jgi:hypothetical protein